MTQYHVGRNGSQFGPYEETQARELFMQGNIAATDLVWCEGMSGWRPAGEIFGADVSTSPPTIEVTSPASNQELLPATFSPRVAAAKQMNAAKQQTSNDQDPSKTNNGVWQTIIAIGVIALIGFTFTSKFAPTKQNEGLAINGCTGKDSNMENYIKLVASHGGNDCTILADRMCKDLRRGQNTPIDWSEFEAAVVTAGRIGCVN